MYINEKKKKSCFNALCENRTKPFTTGQKKTNSHIGSTTFCPLKSGYCFISVRPPKEKQIRKGKKPKSLKGSLLCRHKKCITVLRPNYIHILQTLLMLLFSSHSELIFLICKKKIRFKWIFTWIVESCEEMLLKSCTFCLWITGNFYEICTSLNRCVYICMYSHIFSLKSVKRYSSHIQSLKLLVKWDCKAQC